MGIGASTGVTRWTAAAPEPVGTTLDTYPSPGFSRVDRRGVPVSLESLRGSAAALTFVNTRCPDICPLIAARTHEASEILPAGERDTPEAECSFSARFGLEELRYRA